MDLSKEELEQEYDRILEAINPNAPDNIARFSYAEETYKNEATVEQTAMHFAEDGNLIHKDTEEAKMQKEEEERRQSEHLRASEDKKHDSEAGEEGEEGDHKQLHNQFNYSQRATQTFNYTQKEVFVFTEPPPSMDFSATATAWEIYDSYKAVIALQKKNAGKQNNAAAQTKSDKKKDDEETETTPQPKNVNEIYALSEFKKSANVVERMVNQNTHDEILQDFKFWDDDSDNFKDVGSLLPLWKFENEKLKKKQVTAICWNTQYSDLFAVGFGSYNFMKQGVGMINVYSLKNPSFPEFSFQTESGVMSLDFHPKHSSLLAVGLYDGTVMIFDIRQNQPIIQSTVKTGKHNDCVWQVYWQTDGPAQSLNFFSVSADGRVTSWTLSKSELQHTDVMILKVESASTSNAVDAAVSAPMKQSEESSQDEYLVGLAGGTCIDFNKKQEHLFVVGTEEGRIHLCSKAYNSQYLKTYEGHNMSVYAVKWNYYHSSVFISASADWTVKLWHKDHTRALMVCELGSSVGDVAWAPYSATVFAAVTDEGKVHVYDLNVNKHDSLCDQLVVKKAKLTHVAFNPKEYILLIGDDKGLTQTMKLSPNLRKITKLAENQSRADAEVAKLNSLIDVAIKNFH